MGRARAVAEHLIALPAAVLLFALVSVVTALISPRLVAEGYAIDIQAHDTYYLVAHFHITSLVLACGGIVGVVALRHRGLNWLLRVGAALLVLHLIASAVLLSQAQPTRGAEGVTTFVFQHSGPGWAEAYLLSGVGAILGAVAGLLVSFIGTLRSDKLQ